MEKLEHNIPSGCYGKCQADKSEGFAYLCRSLLKLLHYIFSHMQECSTNRSGVWFLWGRVCQRHRERWKGHSKAYFEISTVAEETTMPVNMDTFWPSISNKAKPQALLRKWVTENAENKYPEVEIVFSNFCAQSMSLPCQIFKEDCHMSLPELDMNIEEADVWLMPHAMHATRTGAKRLVILSGDTDVMVLALFSNSDLETNGLSELWMHVGVGDSTRYIPLHVIAEKKQELCTVSSAIHILTGCDTTSKVGTKLSALKPPAIQLLSEFGKSLSSPNQYEIIRKAEEYLVQVLKPSTTCLYTTYVQTHCLQNVTVDPTNYGFEKVGRKTLRN